MRRSGRTRRWRSPGCWTSGAPRTTAPCTGRSQGALGRRGAHIAIDTCHLAHAADVQPGAAAHDPRDLVEQLRLLASYYHVASWNLAAMGYPPELWQDELDLFVAGLIDVALADESILDGRTDVGVGYLTGGPDFEMRLAATLDAHDASLGADRPLAGYEPWPCGGGPEYTVTVSTDPAGGSVYMLRRFSVELCLALGLEPFSAECEGVLTPPSQAIGIGHYGFLIHWPEEQPSCGYVEFGSGPADDPGATIAVSLNPPPGVCHGWH